MLSIQAAMSMSERLSDDNSTDDPAVFDNTGTTLLHLTGNVINGAASKSLEEDNKDGDEENKGSEDNEETPVNATQVQIGAHVTGRLNCDAEYENKHKYD